MLGNLDDIYIKYAARYLMVGNPAQAAVDVGVPKDSVKEFLQIAATHPEVVQMIEEAENEVPDFNDASAMKRFILKQLLKESQYKGPGAQAAARIAALKAIAELTGIEPPKKIDVNTASRGGMMMVPLMDAAMWETSAEKMQDELKKAARE